jgi:hypothetical protein
MKHPHPQSHVSEPSIFQFKV